MNFKVDFTNLSDVSTTVTKICQNACEAISSFTDSYNVLANSNGIEGEAAVSIRAYFEDVYTYISFALSEIVQLYSYNFAQYFNGYLSGIDSQGNAIIYKSELENRANTHQHYRTNKQNIDEDVQTILASISDLCSPKRPNYERAYDAETWLVTQKLKRIISNIEEYESNHTSSDFGEIESLISKTSAFVNDVLAKGRGFSTNYKSGDIYSSEKFKDLYNECVKVNEYIEANEVEIQNALEDQAKNQVKVEQANIDERAEQMKFWKFALAVGVAVVAVVTTVATGGTASVLVLGAIGAISGAVSGLGNSAMDQYIQKGSIDATELIIDGAIAAGTGFITGCVGGTFAKIPGTSFVKELGSGMLENVCTGMIERAGDSLGEGITTGKWDFRNVIDVEEISKDGVKGGIGSISKTMVGTADNLKAVKNMKNSRSVSTRVTYGMLTGASDKASSGVATRYVNDRLEGKSHEEALKDAGDRTEVAKDAISGGSKGGAKSYNTRKLETNDYKSSTVRNSLPKNAPNQKEWRAQGGSISRNRNGSYTYKTSDGYNIVYDKDGNLDSGKSSYGYKGRMNDYYSSLKGKTVATAT